MPDCDGPTLAAQLLAIRPTMKVVFVSGYAAMPRGATLLTPTARFLQKPYTRAELGRMLASLR
jgi:FixJ family two-component response regulator